MAPLSRSRSVLGMCFALSLCSCLGHKTTERTQMAPTAELALAQQCAEMKAIGEFSQLQAHLDRQIARLSRLAEANPTYSHERVSQAAHELEGDVAKLKALAKPEWHREQWESSYEWVLRPEDFDWFPNGNVTTFFDLRSIEILDAQLFGRSVERARIETRVESGADGPIAVVKVAMPSTPFELCELSRTLALVVRVQYDFASRLLEKDFVLSAGSK